MFFTLALALQTSVANPAPTSGRAVDDILSRARRAESQFLLAWREKWKERHVVNGTSLRNLALHCHADEVAPHIITTPFSRRSMCPIWFSPDDEQPDDDAAWIDNAIAPRDREQVKSERAALLRLFDSAAAMTPGNSWVTGQRVRLYVDQRQYDRAGAIAKQDCTLAASYCAMLAGFVLEGRGDRVGADAAYGYAATLLSPQERCVYLGIRPFIAKKDRAAYDQMSCAARDPLIAQFWWLADPLFTEQGNERIAVQLHRQMLVLLHSALTADELFDWRVQFGAGATGEMIMRYGWPSFAYSDWWENREHFNWLGFTDSSVNASIEYLLPRYHTTPSVILATKDVTPDSVGVAPKWSARREKWDDEWWPVEHFSRSSLLIGLDYQAALFRRATTALVAFGTRPDSTLMPDSMLTRYSATLLAVNGPTDSARRAVVPARVTPAGSIGMSLATTPGAQFIAAEITAAAASPGPAARARFTITAPRGLTELPAGEVALSDPLFFRPPPGDGELPDVLAGAVDRMLPSLTLAPGRVGVFWEVYGLSLADSVDMTLTVNRLDHPGLLRRIGTTLGVISEEGGSISVKWRDQQSDRRAGFEYIGTVPTRSRAVVLDVSRLRAGRYAIEVSAGRPGSVAAVSRKEIRISVP